MINLLYFILGSLLTFLLSSYFKGLIERWRRRPSWNTFFKCLTDKRVLEPIQAEKPDVIIGINNGIVPASILATNLGIEDLHYYHIFPEVDDDGTRKDPKFHELKCNLSGKRILIVDDQLFSGKTMDAMYRFVLSQPGVQKSKVVRLALFRQPLAIQELELPSPGILGGAIRRVPWSFTKEHVFKTQRYKNHHECG